MKEKFFVLIVVVFSMLAIPLSALSTDEEDALPVTNSILSEPYAPQNITLLPPFRCVIIFLA